MQQQLLQGRDSRLYSWRQRSSQGSYPGWYDRLVLTMLKRYHIGESLLPSVRPFLKFIGAEETIKSYGFTIKACDKIWNSSFIVDIRYSPVRR